MKEDVIGTWSHSATLIAILSSLGGILVALSVKYSSSIKKCLAVSGSIVITTVFGHFFQKGPMNASILFGSLLVIASVWYYNRPKSVSYIKLDVESTPNTTSSSSTASSVEVKSV